jgi:hypothetical protein
MNSDFVLAGLQGRLKADGSEFERSKEPFRFTLGTGEVIQGMQGVVHNAVTCIPRLGARFTWHVFGRKEKINRMYLTRSSQCASC